MSQLNDYLGDDRVCNEDFEEDNSERLDSDKEFEDELIRTVAEPFLETLRSLNDAFDVNVIGSTITVHPYNPETDELEENAEIMRVSCPVLSTADLPEDFLTRLEAYLQKSMDELYAPIILH